MKMNKAEFIEFDGEIVNINEIKWIRDNGNESWIVMGLIDDDLNNVIVVPDRTPKQVWAEIKDTQDKNYKQSLEFLEYQELQKKIKKDEKAKAKRAAFLKRLSEADEEFDKEFNDSIKPAKELPENVKNLEFLNNFK